MEILQEFHGISQEFNGNGNQGLCSVINNIYFRTQFLNSEHHLEGVSVILERREFSAKFW